ncbi:hypothetical protein LEP1GSC188_1826 [Leptospira weilii serovar Topaz str. LT2116]|uniref:Uncharacterized protein n=1 Tax=Leptospira weilii serovar Topaz str. LT2116 TaxID=1088540 RepID=M3EFH2_9LEPT|nr:hypothetical protein LEP1GSC188_1826 [Leptospira weilii serovar Topaz str. LT2116]
METFESLERVPKPSDFNKIFTDCCSCSYVLGQTNSIQSAI